LSRADYPVSYLLQVEGDSEVKAKLSQVDNAFADNTAAAEQGAEATGAYSGALGSLSERTEETQSKTRLLGQVFKESSLGIASLASSASGLYFGYDNLEKVQTRVDRAEKTLTTSKAELIAAQQRVVELSDKETASGAEWEQAQLRLKAAQDGVAISTDRLTQSQGDLSQSQVNFALGVLPTVFSAMSTVQSITTALRTAKLAEVAVTGTQSVANLGAIGSFTAVSAAEGVTTAATGELTVAQRLLDIAMGPVGWTILGVSTFMGLFATNAFGLRDAINAAGKAIGDALPGLKLLLDPLAALANTLFPEAKDKAKDFQAGVSGSLDQTVQNAGTFETSVTNSNSLVGASFTTLQNDTASSLSTISNNALNTAATVESAAARIRTAAGTTGISLPSASASASASVSVSAPASDYRTVPNPIGADIQVYDPYFGSKRISDVRTALSNGRPATVDTTAYNSIFHAGNDSVLNALNLTMTTDSEGQMILKKAVAGNSDVRINVNNIN
jgi:hypothetical protein